MNPFPALARGLNQLSIGEKISLIGATCIVFLSVVLSAYTISNHHQESMENLQLLAEGLTYPIHEELVTGLHRGIPFAKSAKAQASSLVSLSFGERNWKKALRFTGMMDADGMILAHSNQTKVGKQVDLGFPTPLPLSRSPGYQQIGDNYVFFVPVEFRGDVHGYLFVGFDSQTASQPIQRSIIRAGLLAVTLTLVIVLIFFYSVSFWVTGPIQRLTSELNSLDFHSADGPLMVRPSTRLDEIGLLTRSFNQLLSSLYEVRQKLVTRAQEAAVAKLARQVAHDIRSPLSALNMAVSGIRGLTDSERNLIRSATQRITDIANDLGQKRERGLTETAPKRSVQHLASLIESLLSEKRIQFRSRPQLNIYFVAKEPAQSLFSSLEPTAFQRVLSNLIDNSAEALGPDKAGNIRVELKSHDESVVVCVTDDGTGIPADILPQLTQKGATFGKKGGSGLGLHYARETTERFGGTFSISSQVGEGTTVSIELPREKPPHWFCEKIVLEPGMTVFCLDDDISIYYSWKSRLMELNDDLELVYAQNAHKFVQWFETELRSQNDCLFLFDYELVGSNRTGLEIIEQYKLTQNAILVTSHFEEPSLLEHCQRLGIKLLPKLCIETVQISVEVPDEESVMASSVSNRVPNEPC